jgi:hypothetical protein
VLTLSKIKDIMDATAIPAYDEVATMLANLDPSKIIELKPSESSIQRLSFLLEKNSNGKLTTHESYELDRMLALDHLIALAKAHARIKLAA